MKRTLLLAMAGFLIGTATKAQTVHKDYVDGEIWVKLKNEAVVKRAIKPNSQRVMREVLQVSDFPYASTLNNYGVTSVVRPFSMVEDEKLKNVYRIKFNNINDVDALVNQLNREGMVEYAEKSPLLKKTLTPNDPDFNAGTQWGLFQINATTAWNLGTGDANVVVAIVDDAVEITHSDIAPVTWTNTGEIPNNSFDDDGNGYIDDVNGYDVSGAGDNDPNPDNPISAYDHGTHVAGIAGAASDNNNGIASIGYNLSLMAVKATNSPTAVTDGYPGIIYAVESGADVINMSWGGSGMSTTYANIITWAYGQGVVLVAAAGNDNVSSTFYPAGYPEVISVASSTTGDVKSGFSNYGSWIDITAPGSGIYSTIPGNSYGVKQGTSMASPMVAGLAGLILSLNPSMTPADVENCIRSTADNIDAANPSYIGQLGDGRINALAAMNCAAATLSWPPVAEFQADATIIYEGQTVNFTDLSYYNPTNWQWTFTGGTPGTFNGQNPGPITYNTAGTYAVSLMVTNANGSHTETKTAYITVNALTGCDTITNTIPSDPNFTWTWTAPNGYIGGHNYMHPAAIAEKYTGLGPTSIMGAEFYFTEGETTNPASFITLTVWNDNAGAPGTVAYSETIPIDDIEWNVTQAPPGQFYITNVNFDLPATVTTTDFYVGYQITYSGTDTVNCAMTDDLISDPTRPNTMWYYIDPSDNPLSLPTGWIEPGPLLAGAEWSMHIYPRITQTPPTAVITSNSPVCEGDFMNFDGTTSPNSADWQWAINGTNDPFPIGGTPSVQMTQSGNHWVYMAAYNGCGFFHVDSIQVTVNPSPSVAITTTADTICPGNTADLTASGATSYTWTPGATLSCTNCPNPTASPTSTTTYTVTGTQGGCSNFSDVTIVVDDATPTAQYIASADTVCEGDAVSYNGAVSSGGSSWAWTFTGGDISSSTSSNPTVVYSTAGTYNVDLTVTNTCSQNDQVSGTIVVLPAASCGVGIGENNLQLVNVNYDAANQDLLVDLTRLTEQVGVSIMNPAGQLVKTSNLTHGDLGTINVSDLSYGLYMLVIDNGSTKRVIKFVR